MKKSLLRREILLVLIFFLAGIVFRLWFITLAPQPFAFDQSEYEWYAAKIFYHPQFLASHSYRSYPYPLLMALIYNVVGFGNHQGIFFVQAVLDSLVGLMVYGILRYGMRARAAAWIGYILYLFNPFTSGYVGVVLSEVLAGFFITATIAVGIEFVRRPRVLYGLVLGLCAGMAAETRNAAFIWAAIPIALTLVWVPWKKHFVAYVGIIAGLILTVLYPLYTNWRDYQELSITKVDSFYAMEFFNGASLKILPPFTYTYPMEQQMMWYEYWTEQHPGRTTEERKAIAEKYWQKGWNIVKADPIDYLKWRFFKAWYVWQKENFFFYRDPFYAPYKMHIWTGNLGLLLFAIIGFLGGYKIVRASVHTKQGRAVGLYAWAALVGSILYGTVAFSISHAEYRLTVPFYSIVILLAALGIVFVLTRFLRRKKIQTYA